MKQIESWWVLSMSACCLYTLLAARDYQHSLLQKLPLLKSLPVYIGRGLSIVMVPVFIALLALSLSEWMTEQSFAIWFTTLEEFGALLGGLLSLQAMYFLFHERVYGGVLTLTASTLSLQLWLYYQALGMDFYSLGLIYAFVLFVFLVGINFLVQALSRDIRLVLAKPVALIVILIQWLFSTQSFSAGSIFGFEWLSVEATLYSLGLLMLVVGIGYLGQFYFSHVTRIKRMY